MFIFEMLMNKPDGEPYNILVVFSGQLEGDETSYSYFFEKEFQRFIKAEAVIFLYPAYLDNTIMDYFRRGNSCHTNISRFGSTVPVELFNFNGHGKLTSKKKINKGVKHLTKKEIIQAIITNGLKCLMHDRVNEVVLKAPPGTVFKKPSEKYSEEFIKASGLCRDYCEVQFVAFCLLTKIPRGRKITQVWIDTAGISAIAEAVCYYLHKFSNSQCKPARYRSFTSYAGKDAKKPDVVDDVWVIISASNSNSLYTKMVKEWSLNDDQAVTILTFCNDPHCLLNIDSFSKTYKQRKEIDSRIKVAIVGENFTAEISEPNKVLVKAIHKPAYIDKSIRPFIEKGVFKCNKISINGRAGKPIFIEFNEQVSQNTDFDHWLEKVVNWYIPHNLGWVVVRNDSASQILYSTFLSKLEKTNINNIYKKVDFNDARTEIRGNQTAVILSTAISSGRSLLNLNRDMRISKHEGNRIFITPFVTAPSRESFKIFSNTLKRGPSNLNYQFLHYFEIFIGHEDGENSWELERNVIKNFESEFWEKRLRLLEQQATGINGQIGTPPINSEDKLLFSRDFAFWNSWDYNPDKVDHESIYATISTILQGLREDTKYEGKEDCLKGHVYRHAVIDPDNFTRFNDPILQSCLWRAAKASELDYRRSDALSEVFCTTLIRLLQDMKNGNSKSALDLLIGIAIKKIMVGKQSLSKLLNETRSELSDNADAKLLIDYIDRTLNK